MEIRTKVLLDARRISIPAGLISLPPWERYPPSLLSVAHVPIEISRGCELSRSRQAGSFGPVVETVQKSPSRRNGCDRGSNPSCVTQFRDTDSNSLLVVRIHKLNSCGLAQVRWAIQTTVSRLWRCRITGSVRRPFKSEIRVQVPTSLLRDRYSNDRSICSIMRFVALGHSIS